MPTTSASNKCRWKHKSKDNDFFFFNKKTHPEIDSQLSKYCEV